MKEFYISKSTCEEIHKSIGQKGLTYKEVAKLVGSSASTICRICNGKTKRVNLELVQKLEVELDVLIPNVLEDTSSLVKRINEIEKENSLLKELLMEKWKG